MNAQHENAFEELDDGFPAIDKAAITFQHDSYWVIGYLDSNPIITLGNWNNIEDIPKTIDSLRDKDGNLVSIEPMPEPEPSEMEMRIAACEAAIKDIAEEVWG